MSKPTPFLTALDLMTPGPVVVTTTMTVLEAAARLVSKKVSNAPVVDQDSDSPRLMGFVSETDFMRNFANGLAYRQPALPVSEVMRVHPVSVRAETGLVELAAIFAQHGYRHLPVLEGGVLAGMVSRHDVLNGLLMHHGKWTAAGADLRHAPNFEHTSTAGYIVG